MPDDSTNKSTSPVASFIAIAKDAFALLRDSALFAIGALLLFLPATFNSILTEAGFEEGSFAGLKWKAALHDTDTQLLLANDTIAKLEAQNQDLLTLLEEATGADEKSDDKSSQRQEVERLALASRATAERAKEVQTSVSATLKANERLTAGRTIVESTDRPPPTAFCYQEDNLGVGSQRYSVHCHTTLEKCESARGPNPRTKQSRCESVDLQNANWNPRHPGWQGSWFQFRSEPFGAPFPQLPE